MRHLRKGTATLMVLLLLLAGMTPVATAADAQPLPTPTIESIEGTGFLAAAICAGCVAGALGIALSGTAAIIAAAATNGSTLVAIGCIGACYEAFD